MEEETSTERHWSTGEWTAFFILIAILSIAVVFIGWAIYAPTLPCDNPGCPPSEALNVESSQVNSPTDLSLKLINTGSKQAALATCYIKDTNGDTYTQSFSPQPVINPNGVSTVEIILSQQLSGQPFTFQHGNYYTIVAITARNSQFTFTILA